MNKTEQFLNRIGLSGRNVEQTVEFLAAVQEACVLTIPYENLDILAGKPVSLEKEAIFHKIVVCRRGGYCFELNALLHHMLEEMGFQVRSCFARFLRGESQIPFRRHRIVVVNLGGQAYMLDIGVGQVAPRLPLKLTEGEIQTQNGETYRFVRDPELGWILEDLRKDQWNRYISFTTERQYEADFEPASFWCQQHPDSPFNKGNMLAIKTTSGRKTVDNRTYKVFEGENLALIEENVSESRLEEIFRLEFGL